MTGAARVPLGRVAECAVASRGRAASASAPHARDVAASPMNRGANECRATIPPTAGPSASPTFVASWYTANAVTWAGPAAADPAISAVTAGRYSSDAQPAENAAKSTSRGPSSSADSQSASIAVAPANMDSAVVAFGP